MAPGGRQVAGDKKWRPAGWLNWRDARLGGASKWGRPPAGRVHLETGGHLLARSNKWRKLRSRRARTRNWLGAGAGHLLLAAPSAHGAVAMSRRTKGGYCELFDLWPGAEQTDGRSSRPAGQPDGRTDTCCSFSNCRRPAKSNLIAARAEGILDYSKPQIRCHWGRQWICASCTNSTLALGAAVRPEQTSGPGTCWPRATSGRRANCFKRSPPPANCCRRDLLYRFALAQNRRQLLAPAGAGRATGARAELKRLASRRFRRRQQAPARGHVGA